MIKSYDIEVYRVVFYESISHFTLHVKQFIFVNFIEFR